MEAEIERFQSALAAGMHFALDVDGVRDSYLADRKDKAGFQASPSSWSATDQALRQQAGRIQAEFAVASPALRALVPAAAESISLCEEAFDSLRTAILDFRLEEPALPYWEHLRNETALGMKRVMDGHSDHATCEFCGMTFVGNFERLAVHVEQTHRRPGQDVKMLMPIADHRQAIESAVDNFKEAHSIAASSLALAAQGEPDLGSEPGQGGRPHHPWRDIMVEQSLDWDRHSETPEALRPRARRLLEWARTGGLPLVSRESEPKQGTIRRWISESRS